MLLATDASSVLGGLSTSPGPFQTAAAPPASLVKASRSRGPSSSSRLPVLVQVLPSVGLGLSASAHNKLQLALSHGLAPSTLKGYNSSVKQFLQWCQTEKVADCLQFPTAEVVLCAYAASDIGRLGGGSARKRMSALKAWHAAQNVPWNGSKRLSYVLTGVEKLAPSSSTKPPRPPITASMLQLLANSLDASNGFDCAVMCCSLIAFWGQCRLGELLPTNSRDLAPTSVPARSHVTINSHLGPVNHGGISTSNISLHLPRTKTQPVRGQRVALVRQSGDLDPISSLLRHLHINSTSSNLPLFAYRSDKTAGAFRVLTKTAFLARCNEIWSSRGLPVSSGHSFRIGGTTELLLAGVPPDVVKAMGRWSSDAFLRYWRSLGNLASLHATAVRRST